MTQKTDGMVCYDSCWGEGWTQEGRVLGSSWRCGRREGRGSIGAMSERADLEENIARYKEQKENIKHKRKATYNRPRGCSAHPLRGRTQNGAQGPRDARAKGQGAQRRRTRSPEGTKRPSGCAAWNGFPGTQAHKPSASPPRGSSPCG